MLESKKNGNIVATIIDLVHNMRLTAVAEGVEEEEQLILLKAYKCDFIQGYYTGRPMPSEQAMELVKPMHEC